MNNRLYNCKNPYQGKYKKVLCVCSAGLLRSPTAAEVLLQPPFGFNTRSCGYDVGHALVPLDEVLIEWADEIVVMDEYQQKQLQSRTNKPIFNLKIGDSYEFRDWELRDKIKENYIKETGWTKNA